MLNARGRHPRSRPLVLAALVAVTVTLGAPVEDTRILAAVDDAGYSAVRVA